MNRIKVTLLLVTLLLGISCKSQNFFWSHTHAIQDTDLTTCVEYGLLYNWYSLDNSVTGTYITSSDTWSVPTEIQYDQLISHLGGTSVAGGHLKEPTLTYWSYPNDTVSDNSSKFNARGTGYRDDTSGAFFGIKSYAYFWATPEYSSTRGRIMNLAYNTDDAFTATGGDYKEQASPIRLVSDATGHADGDTTTYVGNDGQIYNAVCINQLYWTTDNLKETLFRDGSIIPFHGADNDTAFTNSEWAALTTAGVCAYDNNTENVGCNFSWPNE